MRCVRSRHHGGTVREGARSGARRAVAALAFWAATTAVALAADETVEISGRVTDRSGRTGFEGAIVRLDELGLEVATGPGGAFRFPASPAGAYTLVVRYVGTPVTTHAIDVRATGSLGAIPIGADVPTLANVLVVGRAAAQAEASSHKRAADVIVDVIAADGLGELPDQNVTDALKRLPGVSIVTEQGEGRFVTIRGVDPNLNAVSIGGARLPTGEDDARQVALDLVPAELLERVEVAKTATPDMDGDGLGGSIELRTLSAFERPAASANARVEGHYNEIEAAWSGRYAATATRVLPLGDDRELGLAFAGSVLNREFGWENLEASGGWPARGSGDDPLRAAERIEQRDYRIDFDRRALALNADFRAGTLADLHVRAFHSTIDEFQSLVASDYRFAAGELAALEADGATFEDARIDKTTTYRLETRRVDSVVAGGGRSVGPWRFDANAAWARATEREPGSLAASFEGEHDVAYRDTGPRPLVTPLDDDAFDPASYALAEVAEEVEDLEDRETHVAADARRELTFAARPAFLKLGAKLRRRDKAADVDLAVYDEFGRDVTLAEFASSRRYGLGAIGPTIAPRALRRFVDANRDAFELDDEETLIESRGADYAIGEDVDAAYLMGGADFGAWRVVAGARLERTSLRADGTRVTVDAEDDEALALEPVSARVDYTDVLPGLHIRFEPSARLLVRAALTRSLARPSFGELAPAQRIDLEAIDGEIVRRAEIGDPTLAPYRSTNVDLSVEYYDDEALTVFSAALFGKRIEDFVVRADVADLRFPGFEEVIAPVNGDRASLVGVELAWTRRFGELPPPWNGLLVSANATWVDSKSTLPLAQRELPLPNQSDVLANLALGYERGGFSARIAGNFRGERLVRLDEPEDPAFDVYEADRFLLDLSFKYRFDRHWQLAFEALNVADRPLYEFYGDRRFLARYEDYGRTYQLGLKYDF